MPELIRVLVAEDDPDMRTALGAMLQRDSRMELVGLAEDADQAIDLATSRGPDIVLVDVKMPAGGGTRATEEIRRRCPQTRILGLSAYEDRATVFEMLRAGAAGYLIKGTPGGEILDAIQRVWRGEATLSPEVTAEVVGGLASQLERERMREDERRQEIAFVDRVLGGEGLSTVLQPIVDLRDRAVVGAEALSRFSALPERTPDVWFSRAWAVDLGMDLELAAARSAASRLPELPRDMFLSINVSPVALLSPETSDFLHSVPARRVVIEMTEHVQVDDYGALGEALGDFRRRGGRVAVDDVGAGFASLRHILQMDPEFIKLDIEITRGLDTDRHRHALAAALTVFAKQIGSTIVAEGIETESELQALRALGVSHGQGYLLGRPADSVRSLIGQGADVALLEEPAS
jgi:EAL domain-containing protein (putative c-di-GMP-specific phosphodiesterase class I)/CheY-like chemotaxis protein